MRATVWWISPCFRKIWKTENPRLHLPAGIHPFIFSLPYSLFMDNQKIIIALLAVLVILLAAVVAVILMPPAAGTNGLNGLSGTVTPTPTPGVEAGSGNQQDAPSAQAMTTTELVNSIATMEVTADVADWDATPGNNGYVIHYRFFDAAGRLVTFAGANRPVTVYAYTPETDINKNTISNPRVIFKGYTRITASADGDPAYPLSGIYMPFRDITYSALDRGVGKITLEMTLPNGNTISGSAIYRFPK
ncbi:MAG: hypothetical protein APR53_02500 [Methanoculleus sp. SDB]|nr:MAG: hypothetical protein APR53_02500 [Methanoculleus sp. SDB]